MSLNPVPPRRGSKRWLFRYVLPYYPGWMGRVVDAAQRDGIPEVRRRASALSDDDIRDMLRQPWRVQVMGAWYAIAKNDPVFADPVHESFDRCFGTLTAPALAVAVLTYPTPGSREVLQAYRARAVQQRFGGAGFIDAALRRLGDPILVGLAAEDDRDLEELLEIARQLQEPTVGGS